ncbi:MAG TPA: PadR family transcriptional regulator [Actinomycetota bacterium]|jgi:DNA-binding PadR family transcriptional regulator|nr:PadR family transcriptional regulator [Actinomycetota bacterium]
MPSKVEIVILGLLAEGPRYGYELLERYRYRAMEEWVEVGKASVYQALRRLEDSGALTGRQQEGTEGPDRRVYRLARPGRQRLHRTVLESLAEAGPYGSDGGPGLGFVHLLDREEADTVLTAREAALRARRGRLAQARRALVPGADPGDRVAARLLRLQDELAGTELRWLVALRRDLAELGS